MGIGNLCVSLQIMNDETKCFLVVRRGVKGVAKFMIALAGVTVICTILWQIVGDRLYDCTDDNMLGYFRPGSWVHDHTGHGIATVQIIVHDRAMSEPDTIKEGWSVTSLWSSWLSLFIASLIGSFLLARLPWSSKRGV